MKNLKTILLILIILLFSYQQTLSQQANSRTIIFDHDGGYNDLLSLVMLLSMPHIEIEGIIVTPADCYPRPTISATLKILRFFGKQDIEVSEGVLLGKHTFPREWRNAAYHVDALPILNESDEPLPKPASEAGHEFLARKLKEANKSITLLITGPLTNLAAVLKNNPILASKIDEVIWMGGAINVPGNVQDYEHDGSAEWNAYWDSQAVKTVFESKVPITIFPLDATNQLPVSMEFLERLAKQRKYAVSDLAGQIWAMTVGTIPAYEYIYYMWDTMTTGYLGAPQLFSFRDVKCNVITKAPCAGRIKEVAEDGHHIRAADRVNVEEFLKYNLKLLQK